MRIDTGLMSELEQFALFFHQDFSLMAADMVAGARMYVSDLPPERQSVLASEFSAFLEEHRSARALRNGWVRLGAGYAPPGNTLMAEMQEIADLLRTQSH